VANRVPIPGDPEGENDPISAFTLLTSSFSRVAVVKLRLLVFTTRRMLFTISLALR